MKKPPTKEVKYLVIEPEGISQFFHRGEAGDFYKWKKRVRPGIKVALIGGYVLECANY